MMAKIEITKGDITTLNVDAIVNANCYKNSLQLAIDNVCKTVAFPNISTGVYGYPKQEAAEIALKTVSDFCQNIMKLKRLFFVVLMRKIIAL